MPRKTKELENEEHKTKKSTVTTKKTQEKASTTKKSVSKKTTKKKTSTTKAKKSAQKTSTNKKSTTAKKGSTAKSKKKAPITSSTTKKASTKKRTSKKSTTPKAEIVEYYDLPYRYNQTVVKVLAQTPNTLFIYWDISDQDRENFKNQYGENFFETTKPILIIHNDTLNYSFEVEINYFANSWYLHVSDTKCDYRIELGRRPIAKSQKLNTDYIYVSTSNKIESPNDHILFDDKQKMVYFRDVKTGLQTEKSVKTISFMRNMGKIYNIYDLYKELYQNENVENIYDKSNPSS